MNEPAGTRCLDCAAELYIDRIGGQLIDAWGQVVCQASCRPHIPDLPLIDLDRPAAGTRPPGADQAGSGGAGAYRRRQPGIKGAPPDGSASLRDRLRRPLTPGTRGAGSWPRCGQAQGTGQPAGIRPHNNPSTEGI